MAEAIPPENRNRCKDNSFSPPRKIPVPNLLAYLLAPNALYLRECNR